LTYVSADNQLFLRSSHTKEGRAELNRISDLNVSMQIHIILVTEVVLHSLQASQYSAICTFQEVMKGSPLFQHGYRVNKYME
jgi:hypothetical protein